MIITLVTDQFYQSNHGTSVSAQRFYNGLVERGHQVRVIAIDNQNNTAYALKERQFGKPINKIINSQGMQLAKPNKEVMRKAIQGSDIVHVYLPFKLGYTAIELCREMNVPCTAAFHIVPENITSTIYLNNFFALNSSLWSKFYNETYRYVKHIHCPSMMVAKQLEMHNFKSDLHVISNGFNEFFHMQPEEKPAIFRDRFIITFSGRFSREKRYDLIVKAVNESKYRDKIQLIFGGGKGPVKKQIMEMSKKLPIYPVFLGAYNKEMQISFLNFADLYIHPADTEVEGMTCLEAIACGCVPIVSDSPRSACPQFAVHKQSIFKHGDHKDLAKKIDWWIEHPVELKQQKLVIANHAQKFTVDKSMEYYIQMFEAAIKDWDKDFDGKKTDRKPKIINNYQTKM